MAVPAFVNSGAWLNTGLASAATPALPGSRTTNNLLVALIAVAATGRTFSASAGWSITGQINTGGESAAIAWRLVDGTETACAWTWSGGNATSGGQIVQISGVDTVTPVGALVARSGTGTSITIGAVTTTADNSLIWCAAYCANSQTIPTANFYTDLGAVANANTSVRNFTGPVLNSGTVSDTDILTITSAGWASLSFEVHGTGHPTIGSHISDSQVVAQTLESIGNATHTIASQVVLQTLESISAVTNPTKTIASQVVLQTLEAPRFVPTKTLASQVVMQVLRRVDQAPTRTQASQIVMQVLRSRDGGGINRFATATLRGAGRLDVDYLANWPVDLPDCPYEWDEQAQGNALSFKPEVGPQKIRRNYSSQLWVSRVAFHFTNYETTVFEFFYSTTLRDGALAFFWPHPITKIMYTWYFVPKEKPLITRMSPKTHKAEYRLIRIVQVPVQ